jgi:predicted transglutaminase-like cysteine proteinase
MIFAFLATSVYAKPINNRFLPQTSKYISAPATMKDFAARDRTFIKRAAKGKASAITFTPELLNSLNAVNSEGNTLITWRDDSVTWGDRDLWDFPCMSNGKLYDDCDGFALWKMRRLMDLGVDAAPLLFTLTYTETGGYHAVLIVVTTNGSYVLDNRQPRVMTVLQLEQFGYVFDQRVASGNNMAGQWIELKRKHEPTPKMEDKEFPKPGIPVVKTEPPRPLCLPRPKSLW